MAICECSHFKFARGQQRHEAAAANAEKGSIVLQKLARTQKKQTAAQDESCKYLWTHFHSNILLN
jgi:hypothetical protein